MEFNKKIERILTILKMSGITEYKFKVQTKTLTHGFKMILLTKGKDFDEKLYETATYGNEEYCMNEIKSIINALNDKLDGK